MLDRPFGARQCPLLADSGHAADPGGLGDANVRFGPKADIPGNV